MAHFEFVTLWRIKAPVDAVWQTVYDYERWPAWWRGVEQVNVIERGRPDGVGTVMNQVWKSVLPYRLRFQTRVSRVEPLRLFEVLSDGQLRGVGLMQFSVERDVTVVRFDWNVDATEAWMNVLAPVARRVFGWNHGAIMSWGAECLGEKLHAELVSIEAR